MTDTERECREADRYDEINQHLQRNPWTAEDIAFWTGSNRYQPWKDVAAFFQGTSP